MEKRDKTIIVGLIIVIILLVMGIASFFITDNNSNGKTASSGMKIYDFNSEFTMEVPKNSNFLKGWNNVSEFNFGDEYYYLDKSNKFSVIYVSSPLITHELFDNSMNISNKSGNVSVEFEGDLKVIHNLNNTGKIGNSLDDTEFKYNILLQKGHMIVIVSGNDLGFIKSMANTIKFYE